MNMKIKAKQPKGRKTKIPKMPEKITSDEIEKEFSEESAIPKGPVVRQFEIIIYDEDELKRATEWASSNNYEWAYIRHDKDDKKPHYHLMIKNGNAQYLSYFAEKLQIPVNQFEKPKTKRNQWENMIAYLCHETPGSIKDGKTKYDPAEITANGFDAAALIAKYIKQREKTEKRQNKIDIIEDIEQKIMRGEIKKWNYTDSIDISIYTQYRNRIDNAFKFYDDLLAADKSRNAAIYWYQGPTGTGKTTFAIKWAEETGKSYFVSAGTNDPLNGYRGEEVIIFDEYDDDQFKADDLKLICNPHTKPRGRKRFDNPILYAEIIIFTSNKDLRSIYPNENPRDREAIFRRISNLWEFTQNNITIYEWSGYSNVYDKKESIFNLAQYYIKELKAKGNKPYDMLKFAKDKIDDERDKATKAKVNEDEKDNGKKDEEITIDDLPE